MKLLLENWRKYINEEEQSDEQKIFSAFLNNGAHGLQLAEMTGLPIAKDLGNIVQGVRNYISLIENPPEFNLKSTGGMRDHAMIIHKRLERGSTSISSELLDLIGAVTSAEPWSELTDDEYDASYDAHSDHHSWHSEFEEMLLEAGDYVWWHGKYDNMSPNYNIASEERSTMMLNDLKEWAGA